MKWADAIHCMWALLRHMLLRHIQNHWRNPAVLRWAIFGALAGPLMFKFLIFPEVDYFQTTRGINPRRILIFAPAPALSFVGVSEDSPWNYSKRIEKWYRPERLAFPICCATLVSALFYGLIGAAILSKMERLKVEGTRFAALETKEVQEDHFSRTVILWCILFAGVVTPLLFSFTQTVEFAFEATLPLTHNNPLPPDHILAPLQTRLGLYGPQQWFVWFSLIQLQGMFAGACIGTFIMWFVGQQKRNLYRKGAP